MNSADLSAHDHGNCELCDRLENDLARLRLENHQLREEIAALRSLIPLLRSRFESFMIWFENTIAGVH